MKKFIDPNHLRRRPRSWNQQVGETSHRIIWDPSWHLTQFHEIVKNYTRDNGLHIPSLEDLEDFLCSQSPSECVDSASHRPSPIRTTGGCSACSRR